MVRALAVQEVMLTHRREVALDLRLYTWGAADGGRLGHCLGIVCETGCVQEDVQVSPVCTEAAGTETSAYWPRWSPTHLESNPSCSLCHLSHMAQGLGNCINEGVLAPAALHDM